MFDITLVAVVLAVLAVWRLTHLVVAEEGPWRILAHLRRAAIALRLGGLVTCFYCASVWVAVPFALLIAHDWRSIVLCIPALSAGAIVIERLTAREDAAVWYEEEEKS